MNLKHNESWGGSVWSDAGSDDKLWINFAYIDWQKVGRAGPATPKFHHTAAWYTCVSAILKVLSLAFDTPLIICLQALMTSL